VDAEQARRHGRGRLRGPVRAMKVVLADPLVRGHHVVHATYACEALLARGDEVVFVAWRPHPALAPLCALPIEVVYAGPAGRESGVSQDTLGGQLQMRRVIRRAVRAARRRGADVVSLLFLDWFIIALAAALLATPLRLGRVRLYAVMYWMYFERPPGERRGVVVKLKYWLERAMLRAMLSRGALGCLFVFSEVIRARLVARGMPASRVAVIPDPVEVPPAVPEPCAARRELGLPEGDPLFLFFGETRLDKGPDILLAALPSLRSRCTVAFVGPPVTLGETDFEAARRALPAHVTLVWRLERVGDDVVSRYFAAADCVVLPYRRLYLGTSGAMQHAAAFGRPIIMRDVGILGETARMYGLGPVVEAESPPALAAAMDALVAAPAEWRAEVARSARQYGERNDRRVYGGLMRERFALDAGVAR
jgi:glycosyltransferase involved in cell wall biosynthesis